MGQNVQIQAPEQAEMVINGAKCPNPGPKNSPKWLEMGQNAQFQAPKRAEMAPLCGICGTMEPRNHGFTKPRNHGTTDLHFSIHTQVKTPPGYCIKILICWRKPNV